MFILYSYLYDIVIKQTLNVWYLILCLCDLFRIFISFDTIVF